MRPTRRQTLWLAFGASSWAVGCSPRRAASPPAAVGAQRAVALGCDWLEDQAHPDGAWRSQTYGALKDPMALTPAVVKALVFRPGERFQDSPCSRGLDFLARSIESQDCVRRSPYPVYCAALSALALESASRRSHAPPTWQSGAEGWRAELIRHSLGESLGWTPEDLAYGGFGYSPAPPRKGERSHYDADLSSTLFAAGSLRYAGAHPDVTERARKFVLRCQNLPLAIGAAPGPLDDGGFFFTPTRAEQNKAGGERRDPTGRTRFNSYGTMTADGLRALLRMGYAPDHPRALAAIGWLRSHIDRSDVTFPPGDFDPLREGERVGARYYWCWSLAHSMAACARAGLEAPFGPGVAGGLIDALLALQEPGGSFRNPHTFVMEDDPLVATPMALAALQLAAASVPA